MQEKYGSCPWHLTSQPQDRAFTRGPACSDRADGERRDDHRLRHRNLRSSDASREAYELDGTAKTLLEDGTMLTSALRGIGRRSGGAIKLFSLDNVRNGDQKLAVLEVDAIKKIVSLNVYPIWAQ